MESNFIINYNIYLKKDLDQITAKELGLHTYIQMMLQFFE